MRRGGSRANKKKTKNQVDGQWIDKKAEKNENDK